MPFQLRDETVGQNVLYIDNSGNAGLGGLPNSGQSLTVGGTSILNSAGSFVGPVVPPGSPLSAVGSISVPPSSSASVSVSYGAIPTVTTDTSIQSASATSIQWTNTGTSSLTVNYSLW